MIKNRHIKSKRYITPMDVAQHCRKMDVSENGKFIMVDSYEIDFLKSNFTKTRCAIR